MVIVYKNTLKQNINNFIQENQILQLNKDPSETFRKHIQQTIHKCNTIKHINQKNI
jgi:regulator of replication initiation timing